LETEFIFVLILVEQFGTVWNNLEQFGTIWNFFDKNVQILSARVLKVSIMKNQNKNVIFSFLISCSASRFCK